MTKPTTQTQNGFTLIELILYVVVSSTIMIAVAGFFGLALEARVKHQTIAEVEEQGGAMMRLITQTIRNADAVNTPTEGTSATMLSLRMTAPAADPAVFDFSSGVIRISEGAAAPVALTNSRVSISDLAFTNVARSNTPGALRVKFTLAYLNQEHRNEYDYSKTFYGSASLR